MERGFTLWFTGLSGSGKTTLAQIVERTLRQRGKLVELLDGDVVRTHLSKGLGFSRDDRDANILRIGYVCGLLSRNGVIAIASAISPYRDTRDQVRSTIGDFVEVFVDTPLEECRRRDTKGLYHKALAGQLTTFTGISDPYEAPFAAEITVQTVGRSPDECAVDIIGWLGRRGYLDITAPTPASVSTGHREYGLNDGDEHDNHNGHWDGTAYSAEEEADVSARLEALGYL